VARDAVERTLLDLRAELGLSFVLVTHDEEQAARLADMTLHLRDGRLVGEGAAR
jgi:lipoprotein-releasing system ATP-binding protein